jgi:hypothetical protein
MAGTIDDLRAQAQRNTALAEERRRLLIELRRLDTALVEWLEWGEWFTEQQCSPTARRGARMPRSQYRLLAVQRIALITRLREIE